MLSAGEEEGGDEFGLAGEDLVDGSLDQVVARFGERDNNRAAAVISSTTADQAGHFSAGNPLRDGPSGDESAATQLARAQLVRRTRTTQHAQQIERGGVDPELRSTRRRSSANSLASRHRGVTISIESVGVPGRSRSRQTALAPRLTTAVVHLGSIAGARGRNLDAAAELGPRGITANVVAPGFTADTDFFQGRLTSQRRETLLAATMTKREGQVADIAGTIHFLASPAARHITGQVLHVNGGALTTR